MECDIRAKARLRLQTLRIRVRGCGYFLSIIECCISALLGEVGRIKAGIIWTVLV